MRKRLFYTALFFVLLRFSVQAQVQDTIAVAEHLHEWMNVMAESRSNPAFMQTAYSTSNTRMRLRISSRSSDKALQLETGDGHTLGEAIVESYLRLDNRNTVWGGASYQMGRKCNIRFNSTSDYELLYPYVMADTLGGNMENERYAFNGGYAIRLNRWTIGAVIDFRAEHEYRTIDPRPRGIVTDLTLRLGASYEWRNYRLGAGIGTRTYKQTNNVDFYNPLGVIPEYHLTGLGTDYVRFSGAVRSSYYTGTGVVADFQLLPCNGTGAYLSLEGRYMPYENILTELNALPITKLNVTNSTVKMGWKHEGRMGWTAFAGIDLERRNGNEHIAGNSSSTEYRSLITLSMFSDNKYDYYLGGAINVGRKRQFTFNARFGFVDDLAEYVDLKREMAYTTTYGRLGWQWMWHNDARWLVEWNGNIAYYHNNSRRIVMPYVWMDSKITELVSHTYESKTANLGLCETQFHAYHFPRNWKGTGIFLSAGIQFTHTSIARQITLNGTFGVTF